MTAPALHAVTAITAEPDEVEEAVKRLGLRSGMVRVRRRAHPQSHRPPAPPRSPVLEEPPGDGWPLEPLDQEADRG